MYFLGIDWANEKHDLCLLDDAGRIIKQFIIAQDLVGFQQLERLVQRYGAENIRVVTASGPIMMQQLKVNVDIQGANVIIPVNFSNGATPLIGRQAIFAVLQAIGFTTTEWLLQWYRPAGSQRPQLANEISPDFEPKNWESPQSPGIVDRGRRVEIGGVSIPKRN